MLGVFFYSAFQRLIKSVALSKQGKSVKVSVQTVNTDAAHACCLARVLLFSFVLIIMLDLLMIEDDKLSEGDTCCVFLIN